jgi:secreted trypsin-like serine protease
MNINSRASIFIIAIFFGLAREVQSADSPFQIRVTTETRVDLNGSQIASVSKRSASGIELTANGKEESGCASYGRKSMAQAGAWAEVIDAGKEVVRLSLRAQVRANGGHYRTCLLGCALRQCLGVHGNDTDASASAVANATLTIEFSNEFPPADYELDFAANNDSAGFTAELKDALGNVMPLQRENGGPQLLRGKPGAVYFLSTKLPLTASDAGGCCSAQKSGSSTIRAGIRIQRAPILDARGEFVPFIGGGVQTTAYPYVGAIRVDGKLHCTGTLVSNRTVLTAAHCVDGFESRLLASGQFIVGSNITQPQEPAMGIDGFEVPSGPTNAYDPKTYRNDVAVIYLKTPTKILPTRLHNGLPSWADIIARKISLTFVGFGYDVIDNQKVASGIKRESSWMIGTADTATVGFAAGDKGTCKGDSGGPAFLIDAGTIQQVAITSGSYSNSCKDGGIETRVDYFLPWITAKLKSSP